MDNNDNNGLKKKMASGFIWRLLERIGAQGVTLAVSILLARLLSPEEYGIVSIIVVFITLLEIFVDSGFSTALIQKKDSDDIDFSTVFYFNLITCTLLYLVLFFAAPLISSFYQLPQLTLMIRVYGVVLLISSVKNVQYAYVSKKMDYKKFFFSTLVGTITAGVVGIVSAFYGAGCWALIIQAICNVAIDTLVLWFTVKWRPKKAFSFERLKKLFNFGWKIFAAVLLDELYNDLRQLIIGKAYSTEDLAYYNKGGQYPKALTSSIRVALDSTFLPSMSSLQDDDQKLLEMTRDSVRISLYVITPLLVIFIVIAEPLVKLLLTDKWLPCVPYLIIFCLVAIMMPIHSAHFNSINAKGRSDIPLILGIIKTILHVGVLLITINYGVFCVAIGYLAVYFVGTVIDCIPNIKLIHYSPVEQIKDIFPIVLLNSSVFLSSYFLKFLPINGNIIMALQVVVSIMVYLVLSLVFKPHPFLFIVGFVKNKKRRNLK